MFVGRERELSQLNDCFLSEKKEIVLIYGKRRVGKTTLIKEASKSFNGTIVFYEGIKVKNKVNLERFSLSIANAYSEQVMPFSSFKQAFDYLNLKRGKKLIIIDEFPDLKIFENSLSIDSMFREICDSINDDTKIIFSGSHIKMMKSLLEEDNPLFGRFTLTIKLEELDYYEASLLYGKNVSVRKKIELYSVFGGLPYICSLLDSSKTLRENIEKYLIPQNAQIRLYVEIVLAQDLNSVSSGMTILSVLGNKRLKFSEIEAKTGSYTNGDLSRQLRYLLDLDVIRKVFPINKKDDKKKTFYEISNNLVRFYFAYMLPNEGRNILISEQNFYDEIINNSILQFISLRFESIVRQYFIRLSRSNVNYNLVKGVINIGRYWYDDKNEKKNGEFDCVLEFSNSYDVYEVKFFSSEMTEKMCEEEADKIKTIKDLKVNKIGFVCSSGFSFRSDKYVLVSGDMLYL